MLANKWVHCQEDPSHSPDDQRMDGQQVAQQGFIHIEDLPISKALYEPSSVISQKSEGTPVKQYLLFNKRKGKGGELRKLECWVVIAG